MKPLYKGLLLAAIHVALVASLGAKLLLDRETRPRVWVRTTAADPNLFIRGRYVRLVLESAHQAMPAPGTPVGAREFRLQPVETLYEIPNRIGIAFFIPESVPDPSQRPPGEELWAEVTIPKKGPPRPIRLGVKKGDTLTVLDF